eukprot:TRINITY_DN15194_c0_g1_i1.p1 TRINITY_DN15194_c0_g1~~TRINITY_DN15194_c0_g1_i1.p1  ORF type:complete len:325 (-),score=85.29 TRINITY_DN15194_c0_g1_i1:59-1033(-)
MVLVIVELFLSLLLRLITHVYRSIEWVHDTARIIDRKPPKYVDKSSSPTTWTQLAPNVIQVNALNPGSHTLTGTNTYIIGTGPVRVLLDTGEGVHAYVDLLKQVMAEVGAQSFSKIIISHGHIDHYAGIPHVLKAFGFCPVYKRRAPDGKEKIRNFEEYEDNERIAVESGEFLRVVATPGHTSDHSSFILEPNNVLFSGDCILGVGTAVFDDLSTYMTSLNSLLKTCESHKIELIYPGHGPVVTNAQRKITEYIDHRFLREKQIIEVFQKNKSKQLTSLQIARLVYGKIPLQNMASAQWNVLHHLDKLVKDKLIKNELLDLWVM